jgi:2,4-dienoyl-CoA reductase-like NADH-dependent reductase (Old Yellow Enzyme family)
MPDSGSTPPILFSPLRVSGAELKNRIVLSPMCTYSCAEDGLATDWHLVHLGKFALGGAAVVFTEAAAVEPRGRITHGDLGIWSAAHAAALRPVTAFLKAHGALPAIQLAHAGRKASMQRPWHGNAAMTDADAARGELPWDIVAPSPLPARDGWLVPHELDTAGIAAIQRAFAAAAGRADEAGFEVLEIHSAHGYLGHSFLSPVSNRRTDAYGGDRAGRMRFTLETAEAVRAAWPQEKPLFVRISSVDVDGDAVNGTADVWTLDDSVVLAAELKARGVDVVDCSSSGISGVATAAQGAMPLGFRLPYAGRIKDEAGIMTMVVGLILDGPQAEAMLQTGRADLVAIGREALFDPFWALHAARALGVDTDFAAWPEPYGWWLSRREPLLEKVGAR